LYNKFLAPLPGIVLNCVFKVFPFSLVILFYLYLKKKKKILTFVSVSVYFLFQVHDCPTKGARAMSTMLESAPTQNSGTEAT
jgi:hypothetical protein